MWVTDVDVSTVGDRVGILLTSMVTEVPGGPIVKWSRPYCKIIQDGVNVAESVTTITNYLIMSILTGFCYPC